LWEERRAKGTLLINISSTVGGFFEHLGSVSTPSENEKKKEKEGEKVRNLLPPLILSAAPPGARRV
jgi:hypothetical protein